jgi:hypothetical protein
MHLQPDDQQQAPPSDPLAGGIPADLAFDDEPLEPLLYGAPVAAPTPGSVVELWQQGLDRSAACARALAAVLVQNHDWISRIGDLDRAEQCLRLAVASASPGAGVQLAACCGGLARILELKNQMAEAESFYRQALDLQEASLGARHEVTFTTGMRLLNLLETANRQDEAARLRSRLRVESQAGPADTGDANRLCAAALDWGKSATP